MKHVVRGITLVLGNRRFWPFLWKPMLASAGIFLALVALSYLLLAPLAESVLARVGLGDQVAAAGATVAFAVILWFMSSILFITIAGLTSSILWDRLSYEVELTVNPSPPNAKTDWKEWLIDAIPRAGFATFIFCLSTSCFWLVPVGVALASWLCLYDYTASAYLRRRISFLSQFSAATKNRGWALFALTCGVLTLVPLVNILLLPGLVAGGTLLVADNERS